MSYLQNGSLSRMQGVPVENRRVQLLEFIKDLHTTTSPSSLCSNSSLKRFLKISNRPLRIDRNSATSLYEDNEEQRNTKSSSIFSRRKAPESTRDGTLSFITNRDQSTSTKYPTPQGTLLSIAKPTTHKLSKSFYWNRLFHGQKSKFVTPEQETAGKETMEAMVLVLREEEYYPESENHSENDVENPSPGASQEQQLPIDPRPELLEPMNTDRPPVATKLQVHRWKRWFNHKRRQPKNKAPEQEIIAGKETVLHLKPEEYNPEQNNQSAKNCEEPPRGASQKQPIDQKSELLDTDRPPVATKLQVHRWKRWFNHKMRQPKDKAPEQETVVGKERVLQLKQEEYNPEQNNQSAKNCEEPPRGASQEQQPIDQKSELLEPMDTDRPPIVTESEVYRWKWWFNRHKRQHKDEAPEDVLVQKQNNLESANEFGEPRLGVSQENQLPSEPEPERLKLKTPVKRVLFPVATESEVNWKRWFHRRKSQTKVEAPEQKTVDETEEVLELHQEQNKLKPMTQPASNFEEPSLSASQEHQLTSEPEPDRLGPKTPLKRVLPIATESEVNWKRWFPRRKSQTKVEAPEQKTGDETEEVLELHQEQNKLKLMTQPASDFEEPSLGASQEHQLTSEPEPDRLGPKTPLKRVLPIATESEVNWKRWFPRRKSQTKVEAPEQRTGDETEKVLELHQEQNKLKLMTQPASDFEEPSLGASQEHQLTSEPEPDRLEPKTPLKRVLPIATESEVNWKRWFPRRKSQTKVEAPEQKTGDETEEVLELHQEQNKLEPMAQPASDFEEPSIGASQEQQLPSDPEPDRLEPKTPMKSDYISVVAESENAKPHQSASVEVNLPIDPEPERSRPPTRNVSDKQFLSTFKCDHLPVTVESKNAVPNQLASDATEPEDVESPHPASNEVNLPSDRQPESSRPKKQNIRLDRTVPEGQFLSTFKSDHLSFAAEPEEVGPHESALDTAEQEDAEPNQPAPDEVNLPSDPEPERWKPNVREKRFVRNVTEDRILNPFEREHPSAAAKPEEVEPHESVLDTAEQEDAEPNQPATDEVNQPSDTEPERWKPNVREKRFVRNVTEDRILNPFEREHPTVTAKPEDVEPNQPASDKSNSNP